jgi:hypothetical protein
MSLPPLPELLWSSPSLLSSGYQGLFPWGWSGRGVKLTIYLRLVSPVRLHGVVLSYKRTQGLIYFTLLYFKSHDSSVGIVLGYGLDDRDSRVRFPAGAGNSSLRRRIQNGSGAHPASYPMDTRGSSPGGKAAGVWRWPLTSHLVHRSRMLGAIPPLPQYVFMAWCLVKHGQLHFRSSLWLLPQCASPRPVILLRYINR